LGDQIASVVARIDAVRVVAADVLSAVLPFSETEPPAESGSRAVAERTVGPIPKDAGHDPSSE
jgi:hypothetical protein